MAGEANKKETTRASCPTRWARRLLTSITLLFILGFSLISGVRIFQDAERHVIEYSHYFDLYRKPQVILVVIDKEDYKTHFHSRSPLDPDVLRKLIKTVARSEPRIIAIDIDTSDLQFASLQSLQVPTVLVWARQVEINGEAIHPKAFLGTMDEHYKSASGLAVLYDDPKTKNTQRYSRVVWMGERKCLPSLPWVIAARWNGVSDAKYDCSKDATKMVIGDETKRLKINASEWLTDKIDIAPLLKDKIVLLGGTYNDRHYTVAGELNGVQIMANAVETELSGGGWARPSPLTMLVIGLVAWLSVNLLFHYLPFGWAALVAMALILGAALLFSMTRMVTHLPYVVAILVVLVIYESLETAHERKIFSLSEMVIKKLKRIRSAAK